MPSQAAPDDDEARETYNFPPGSFGLVYRADVPDRGAGQPQDKDGAGDDDDKADKGADSEQSEQDKEQEASSSPSSQDPGYKLQAMKWGLIPFWTKRQPDYGSMMRTINARDDSLAQNSGMWTTMKQKKRCIVVAQGFYEWLKKNNGKDKVPHYVKRKDGQLMCFAGLWDCVQYEDSAERLYTYTIVTTESNAQLAFLHDRMPVILDNGSPDLFAWLDRTQTAWTKELQALLKPYRGELECYPVPKEVGKVGNNSPSFIVPIDSAENKQNIANFFGNQKKKAAEEHALPKATQTPAEQTGDEANADETPGTQEEDRTRTPTKRARDEPKEPQPDEEDAAPPSKSQKTAASPPKPTSSGRPTRSATKNASPAKKSPAKQADGSQRITNFFKT